LYGQRKRDEEGRVDGVLVFGRTVMLRMHGMVATFILTRRVRTGDTFNLLGADVIERRLA
jgi:hypothetical protein